jgi:hypothetical protein
VVTGTDLLTLTLWRDHDEELLRMPAISIGRRPVGTDDPAELAAALYREGARRVALDGPIDLAGGQRPATAVAWLLLVSQLTSQGLVVDWDVRLDADPQRWRLLSHLYPPRAVLGPAGAEQITEQWRREFYLCKCVWRQGPGFVEVRDRRAGSLARFIIDEHDYLQAIGRLSAGCPADEVPAAVLAHLAEEGLVGQIGDLAWWIPYRVRRWPSPGMVV